ncbi:MAG TPA: ABC transporter ATP-binding protein [Solirubrobacterales bacterium]|nr:ABC transporter ATP-binding protein [Solirubrobacterales bacterium]
MTRALDGVSFAVETGEFLCVVGPSGCGKTTLLKCLSGLMSPTSGEALLEGTRISEPPEAMALVFQEYTRSLLPWLTVRGNLKLVLRRRGLGRDEIDRLIDNALASVGLGDFAKHHPWQLSGGMQQRVAIARALVYQPRVLLMDEPFASVDAQTRSDLEDLLLRVHAEYGVTVVFVTHDIDEAVYLGDRVIVLSHRPTHVDEVVPVDLPRPRDQVRTKEMSEFTHLRAHVLRHIRNDSSTPMEVQ